jgi:hypothetical protein
LSILNIFTRQLVNLGREFSIQVEGDSTACALVNQVLAWMLKKQSKLKFICSNSQLFSGLSIAQVVDPLPVYRKFRGLGIVIFHNKIEKCFCKDLNYLNGVAGN